MWIGKTNFQGTLASSFDLKYHQLSSSPSTICGVFHYFWSLLLRKLYSFSGCWRFVFSALHLWVCRFSALGWLERSPKPSRTRVATNGKSKQNYNNSRSTCPQLWFEAAGDPRLPWDQAEGPLKMTQPGLVLLPQGATSRLSLATWECSGMLHVLF